MAAACHSVDPDRWQEGLDDLLGRIAGRFTRVEPRRHAKAFVLGLLAGLPRVNCWTVAEHAGALTPDGMQHLLSRASWDHDGAVEDLRDYVVEHLGEDDGVLVVDETGDVKKGTATVGVQRQYTGTAGRIENSQVAVYLVYAGQRGHAFIDRQLYLPRSWVDDRDRCAAAGVPDDVGFATKPALAQQMIDAALDAGAPCSWVAGDEVYGNAPDLRADLTRRGIGYVLAVARGHRITTDAGSERAEVLARRLPKRAWRRHSAGSGAKGERLYDWAWIQTTDPAVTTDAAARGGHWLLIRRSIRTGELAFYRAHAPRRVKLATLARVAGRRWAVEEAFQSGKELAGLDEHQVRTWTSWHRWTALSMLAHAFLTVMAATTPAPTAGKDRLIALTRNEIRRLLAAFVAPIRDAIEDTLHRLRWSRWRRQHQARARDCHYRRQEAQLA